ncbi:hypothetical protein NDN01_04255 [Sphingomonas sp. QA11]|uniref:ApeA N-terminal domain 1-containing protein n=1 Tax=Sphingomonas sp. QA11 TaxID=2950605 RepID=UPI00234AE0EE|nr:HEPN domain-containing protein [Sphingomonas sp. QA11]WCM28145.1 hypothetical protein NDN01_04255 [Sphingomonas sp. QA11]
MSEIEEGVKLSGVFEIGGRAILGDLTISRGATILYLHDAEFFDLKMSDLACIRGTLHDRKKVTLLWSTLRSGPGSATYYGDRYTFYEVMPGYVVFGAHHLDVAKPSIDQITFHVDDAESIFYDFDAFGHVIHPTEVIDVVVEANERLIDRKIPRGPSPEIAYFAGRIEVVTVTTVFGTVRVRHQLAPPDFMASPRSASIRNFVIVDLIFFEPLHLEQTLDRVISLLRFLELLAGRPQNLDFTALWTRGEEPRSALNLYWVHSPARRSEWEHRSPHASETLVSAVEDPEGFATVLSRWLENDAARLDARVRFSEGFGAQRRFSISRLVGAANMFDILPKDAFSLPQAIDPKVVEARDQTKNIFKALPDSPERGSILGALGRLGNLTLRERIRQRADLVVRNSKIKFEHMDIVTDEAVKCRNHYVHGSPGSFTYTDHGGVIPFLTCALEFLFVAADLLDAGWDIDRWAKQGSVGAHPFSELVVEWNHHAQVLLDLRAKTSSSRGDCAGAG